MRIDFWGVRGSVPVCGKDKNKYGGHTPCASLFISDKEIIIIDAGTGIKRLGDSLIKDIGKKVINIHLFLSHFHLDHITGLPFFAPLYSSNTILTVYASSSPQETERYLSRIMAGRFFPVDFEKTLSQKAFKKMPEESLKIGNIIISTCPLRHPGGSIAYKIGNGRKSIVFATDTEHPEKGVDQRLASFARQTDILVYDATLTLEEYESGRQGWGHSTWLAATKVAREAEVRNLYLSHFNPDHSDKVIDRFISLAKKEFANTFGAREGIPVIF